ncbi:ribonuclease H-like domain-containing protein [Tanacetum coccineum]|uniref:Ribonuclease H-like domain-containing protein n=1 Tax=Tanacetum coccineum TaxID=301880 RepID=A0ABQ5GLN2_9ASTR
MVTRSQSGIAKPIDRLSLHTSSISPILKSPFLALKDPHWWNAMYDEYYALVKNSTWILALLVANGSSQQLGVDFDEIFSLDVKPATIRMVLSLVVSRKWLIHQLDVKNALNAFLNNDLSKTVYMPQPLDLLTLDTLIMFRKYALQLLEHAHMVNCNPSRTLVDRESKLGLKGVPLQDPTLYRSLAGGLQYLTFTRPDLSYAVHQICLYTHDPRKPHFAALKRILDFGLHLYASATTSLVGDNLLSWSAKHQHTLSRTNAEAEYRGVVNVVTETAWIRNLLRELHSPLLTSTLVYCDNVAMKGVGKEMSKYLSDFQFRVRVSGCIEAVLHSVNRLLSEYHNDGSLAMLTVDFSNAFNLVDRSALLQEARQGDSLGPFLFSLVLHLLVHNIRDSCKLLLHAWYLDDGTVIGDSEEEVAWVPSLGVKLLGRAVSRDTNFISGMALRRTANAVDLMSLLPQLHDPQSAYKEEDGLCLLLLLQHRYKP